MEMNTLDKIRSRWYDLIHGTDTRRRVQLANQEVVGENKASGHMYFPILPKSMHAVLNYLQERGLDPATATFIDMGSGKGIALLVASGYPFRKIVGVEFGKELAEIARRNIAEYRGMRRPKNIEVLCMDAAEYAFPAGALVVYFFNPFARPVMEKVLKNLAASLREEPRAVTVICDRLHDRELVEQHLNPEKREVFLGFSFYSKMKLQTTH